MEHRLPVWFQIAQILCFLFFSLSDPIEHRGGELAVAGESAVPTSKVRFEVRVITPRS